MFHSLCRSALIVGLIGLVVLALWPYHDGVLRYGSPLVLLGIWSTALALLWRRRVLRAAWLALLGLALRDVLWDARAFREWRHQWWFLHGREGDG